MRGGLGAAPHFSTPGAKRPNLSRFGAHLYPVRFSRFDPKVPHFSVYYRTPGCARFIHYSDFGTYFFLYSIIGEQSIKFHTHVPCA